AKRAGIAAIAATDAHVLVMQHHTLFGAVETVDGADGHTRRVATVHAGHRDGLFTGHTVVERHDAAAVDAPRDFMLVLAGGHTTVAFDAALCIADEFHSCHVGSPYAALSGAFHVADRGFGFLHHGHAVVAIRRC